MESEQFLFKLTFSNKISHIHTVTFFVVAIDTNVAYHKALKKWRELYKDDSIYLKNIEVCACETIVNSIALIT